MVLRTLALAFNIKDLPVSLISNVTGTPAHRDLDQGLEVMRIRKLLAGVPAPLTQKRLVLHGKRPEDMTEEELAEYRRRKRVSVGRAGEAAISRASNQITHVPSALSHNMQKEERDLDTKALTRDTKADLEAPPGVPTLDQQPLTIDTTLERLSLACNLRVDDAAFALAECGLLASRVPSSVVWASSKEGTQSIASEEARILVTQEAVKHAITTRRVKRPLLDLSFVRLE